MAKVSVGKKLRIGFVHPDLGIGGAERLVVDAAVSLKRRGHEVVMFTSRHDPKRCFEETRDGTLDVLVLGSSLPRTLHPSFPLTILFSLLRSLLLSFLILTSLYMPEPASFINPLSPLKKFDVWIVDQQSVCVPVLKWLAGGRVVFYCHFPDKLLSGGWDFGVDPVNSDGIGGGGGGGVKRKSGNGGVSLLKQAYRWPIDKLEEVTTGQADVVVSNSQFTSQIYVQAFPSLSKRPPKVVYPCIDISSYESYKKGKGKQKRDEDVEAIKSDRPTFISLNRFEEKKNIALAIKAFAGLASLVGRERFSELRLVIGGGYDASLPDNVETLLALQNLCETLNLSHHTYTSSSPTPKPSQPKPPNHHQPLTPTHVLFIPNFTTPQRSYLLTSLNTIALLYTPSNEHFGIVPLEAGGCGLVVVAVNSGGPLETIIDLNLVPTLASASNTTANNSSQKTGYSISNSSGTGILLPPNPLTWSKTLNQLLQLPIKDKESISQNAINRVKTEFSLEKLGSQLEGVCLDVVGKGDVHEVLGGGLIWWSLILMGGSGVGLGIMLALGWGLGM